MGLDLGAYYCFHNLRVGDFFQWFGQRHEKISNNAAYRLADNGDVVETVNINGWSKVVLLEIGPNWK